jgi:hypothetical protein
VKQTDREKVDRDDPDPFPHALDSTSTLAGPLRAGAELGGPGERARMPSARSQAPIARVLSMRSAASATHTAPRNLDAHPRRAHVLFDVRPSACRCRERQYARVGTRVKACLQALHLAAVRCSPDLVSVLFEGGRAVKCVGGFVLGLVALLGRWLRVGFSVLFRSWSAAEVRSSCPGFSIQMRAVMRPERLRSLPGQCLCRHGVGSA